jgi:hypothetical protein
MADTSLPAKLRAESFALRRGRTLFGLLGQGKDGGVWSTTVYSAVKAHERGESYRAERNAYMRFRDVGLDEVNGFAVPALLDFDDDLLVIEMTIVPPPFVVDFASVVLDIDPELIEDEGHTLEDLVRERFGDDRVGDVLGIRDELIVRAGAYLSDLHGHNIKFGGGPGGA